MPGIIIRFRRCVYIKQSDLLCSRCGLLAYVLYPFYIEYNNRSRDWQSNKQAMGKFQCGYNQPRDKERTECGRLDGVVITSRRELIFSIVNYYE